jgi:hypothetical protein
MGFQGSVKTLFNGVQPVKEKLIIGAVGVG